jgi:hypothetical protein
METVQIETKQEFYQGQVLKDTNIKHGEGTLLDKEHMTQYTGSFQNNLKHGDTCQLFSIDANADFVSYQGGFRNGLYHGLGILKLA